VAIEDQPASRLAPHPARLEVDEVARAERRRHHATNGARGRTRNGAAPRSRAGDRRTVEGALGGSAGREPSPAHRSGAGVVANDAISRVSAPPDPLAGRLGDRLEDGVSSAPAERQRDPVARRLDLLDRLEPGGLDRAAEPGLGVRDLGVRGDDVDPSAARGRRWRPGAPRAPARRRRPARPARDIRAPTTDQRPPPGQSQRPPTGVVDEGNAASIRSARGGPPTHGDW
jgi:hypothetical protein